MRRGGATLDKIIYPIGSVIIRVDNTNPSIWYGGTWSLLCPGRTLVCIDTADSDFNIVKKTGGNKNLQSHMHNVMQRRSSPTPVSSLYNSNMQSGVAQFAFTSGAFFANSGSTDTMFTDNTGTGNSGNLQPYMVVYIWVRTA